MTKVRKVKGVRIRKKGGQGIEELLDQKGITITAAKEYYKTAKLSKFARKSRKRN